MKTVLVLMILGRLAEFAGLALATWGGAKLGAHLFRVKRFRWFDSQPSSAAWWRRFGVRLLAALAPLAMCMAMFWCANLVGGDIVPTTTVVVLPGSARDAGMLTGDRVAAIDGTRVDDWETLREMVKSGGERQIQIERNGALQVLRVTPNASGRIGVSPREKEVPLGALESAARAVKQPFAIIAAAIGGLARATETDSLRGPVGIVRETASASNRAAGILRMLASDASLFLWPNLVGLVIFEAVTLWLFRITQQATDLTEPSWRLARLQQVPPLALLALLVTLALVTVAELARAHTPAALLVLPLAPAAFALIPTTWLLASQFWSKGRALLIVTVGTLLPCITPIAAFLLWQRARAELRQRGFLVGWFIVREPSQSADLA